LGKLRTDNEAVKDWRGGAVEKPSRCAVVNEQKKTGPEEGPAKKKSPSF